MFRHLVKTLQSSPLTQLFEMVEELPDGVRIITGLKYSNGNAICIRIIDNGSSLTFADEGRTYAYLDEVFELNEVDVKKNITAVLATRLLLTGVLRLKFYILLFFNYG